MKKIIIVLIMLVFCLVINFNSFASDDYPIIETSSNNYLNPEYLEVDFSGNLYYNAWIPYWVEDAFILGVDGFESTENSSVIIEYKERGSDEVRTEEIYRVDSVRFCFEFIFTLENLRDDCENIQSDDGYFRIKKLYNSKFCSLGTDLTKMVYVKPLGGTYNYTPENPSGYVQIDDNANYALVTSVKHKLDLNNLVKSIYIPQSGYTVTLTDDGGYNSKYQTVGMYKAQYLVKNSAKEKNVALYIYVFKEAVPSIGGEDSITISNKERLDNYFTANDYFASLFPVSYGGRTTSVTFTIVDSNNTEHKLEEIYNNEGTYTLRIVAYYNNEAVASKNVELNIINETEAEVYFPNIVIPLTTMSNYDDIKLCKALEETLKLEGIEATNVTVISSTYNAGAPNGEYDVYYSYDVDGKTYFNSGKIIVTNDDSSTNDDNIKNVSLIVVSSITAIALVGLIIIKRKHKTNKQIND